MRRRFIVVTFPHPHFGRCGILEDEDEDYLLLSLEADWLFPEELACILKWDVTEL